MSNSRRELTRVDFQHRLSRVICASGFGELKTLADAVQLLSTCEASVPQQLWNGLVGQVLQAAATGKQTHLDSLTIALENALTQRKGLRVFRTQRNRRQKLSARYLG
jgi:hypothetical protein